MTLNTSDFSPNRSSITSRSERSRSDINTDLPGVVSGRYQLHLHPVYQEARQLRSQQRAAGADGDR